MDWWERSMERGLSDTISEGPIEEAESLGIELAEILLEKGAKEILDEVYQRSGPAIRISLHFENCKFRIMLRMHSYPVRTSPFQREKLILPLENGEWGG